VACHSKKPFDPAPQLQPSVDNSVPAKVSVPAKISAPQGEEYDAATTTRVDNLNNVEMDTDYTLRNTMSRNTSEAAILGSLLDILDLDMMIDDSTISRGQGSDKYEDEVIHHFSTSKPK
jgi:hypothetical protein